VPQDRPLQPAQRLRWLHTQLLDERAPSVAVDPQGLGWAARPVVGEHQLPAQPLVGRMLLDECLEPTEDQEVPACGEVQLAPPRQRSQAQVLQPHDVRLREWLVGEVLQRASPPQTQGLPQQVRLLFRPGAPGVSQQALEAYGVEVVRAEAQGVPRWAGEEHPVREHLPHLRDVGLDHLPGAHGRLLPKVLDQPMARDGAARVQEQDGEQRTLFRRRDHDLGLAVHDLERPQNAELHQCGSWSRQPGRRPAVRSGTPLPCLDRFAL